MRVRATINLSGSAEEIGSAGRQSSRVTGIHGPMIQWTALIHSGSALFLRLRARQEVADGVYRTRRSFHIDGLLKKFRYQPPESRLLSFAYEQMTLEKVCIFLNSSKLPRNSRL
jgi:hypothetical protein